MAYKLNLQLMVPMAIIIILSDLPSTLFRKEYVDNLVQH